MPRWDLGCRVWGFGFGRIGLSWKQGFNKRVLAGIDRNLQLGF